MTSSVKALYSVKNRDFMNDEMKSNFTTEDGNDGTMYPETIPPILLRAS